MTAEPKLTPVDLDTLEAPDQEPRRKSRAPAASEPNRIAADLGSLRRPIGSIRRHPQNPRRHPHLDQLKASIERWGQLRPVLVQRSTGYIVAGNGTHQAIEELGWTEIAANLEELTDAEASAYLLADNRLAELGAYDEDELLRMLQEADAGDGLAGTGWSVSDLERQLRGGKQGRTEADVAPAVPERATWAKPGQLWALGEHRLLIGDATKAADWKRLMGDETLGMVWTDPPYGVAYYGKTEERLTIKGDERDPSRIQRWREELGKMAGNEIDMGNLERLLRGAFTLAVEHTKPGRAVYCASPGGANSITFIQVLADLGVYRQTIVWVKDVFVMGRSDYHYRHELVLNGATPRTRPRHKEGQPIHYGWKPGAAHYFAEDRTLDTVWEFDRPKASREHPTMKPVGLVERSILASSQRGDIIGDCFLGSGTTIIAAELNKRRCYALELDPRYAQVAIERWQDFTGQQAQPVE